MVDAPQERDRPGAGTARPRRRILRTLALALLLVLGIGLPLSWLLRRPLFETWIRNTVVDVLRDEAGIEAEIGAISGTYLTGFLVEDLRLKGDATRLPVLRAASADALEVRFDPLALARNGLKGIRLVRLENASLVLDLTAEPPPAPPAGNAPASAPGAPPPPAGAPAPTPVPKKPFHALFVPPVSVEGLALEIRGKGFTVRGADLDLTTTPAAEGDADAVLSWKRWTLSAGGRDLSWESSILRLHKAGPVVELGSWEPRGGRPTGRAEVVLPDDLEAGTLRVRLLEADLGPAGSVAVHDGAVRLPPAQGFEGRVAWTDLDLETLARVLGKGVPDLRGRATLEVEAGADAFDLDRIRAAGRVRVEGAEIPGRFRADLVDLSAFSLEPGLRADATLVARWQGGEARLEASGALGGACVATFDVAASDLGPVVPALAGRPLVASGDVNGALTGELAAPDFEGTARIQAEEVLGGPSGSVRFAAHLDGRQFSVSSLHAALPGGRVEGAVRGAFPPGRTLDFDLRVEVDDARACLPEDLAETHGVAGSLRSTIRGTWAGGTLRSSADLAIRDGRFASWALDALHVGLDVAGDRIEVLDLNVETKNRGLRVPYVQAVRTPEGRIEGTLPFVRLAVGEEALVSRKKVDFVLGDGEFRLSPMELEGDWARLKVAGVLDRSGDLEGLVVGDRILLDRVGRLLDTPRELFGSLSFYFEVEGTAREPRMSGELSATGIGYGESPTVDLSVPSVRYEGGTLVLEGGGARGALGSATLDATVPLHLTTGGGVLDALLSSRDFSLALGIRHLDLAALPGVKAGGTAVASLKLAGPLTEPRVEAFARCTGATTGAVPPCDLEVALVSDRGGLWLKTGKARLPWAEARVEGWVPLAAPSRGADGSWRFDPFAAGGSFDLTGRVEDVDLAGLLTKLEAPEQYRSLKGMAELGLRVSGSWSDPRITAAVKVEEIWSPSLRQGGRLTLQAELRNGEARLTECELDLAEGFLEAEARVPLNLGAGAIRGEGPVLAEDAALDARVEVRGIRLGPVADYVAEITRTAGRLDGKGTLTGPVRSPSFKARLNLSKGVLVFHDPSLPSLDSLSGSIDVQDRELAFRLQGNSGGGLLLASGEARLTRARTLDAFAMDITGSGRPLLYKGEALRARADLALRLEGTPQRAALTGQVDVFYSVVDHRHDLGAPGTGGKSIVPGFKLPGFERVDLNVKVRTPEGLRVRSAIHQRGITVADIDVRLRGDLALRGTAKEPVLLGAVRTESGKADLPFYGLDVVTGNVNFLEGNPDNPQINILAKTTKGNTTIYVMVNGSLASNEVRFYSEPPMPEGEIQAFLATGVRPEAWRGERAGETLGVQIATLVVKQVSPYITPLFGKSSGEGPGLLDRLSISSERDQGTGAAWYRAEFMLLEWLWLVGERDEYGHYAGRFKARVGFRSRRPSEKMAGPLPATGAPKREPEAPLSFAVEFKGSGLLAASDMEGAVLEDVRRWAEFGRHPSYLEDAAYRLGILFQKNGHHHVKVRAFWREGGGAPAVVFEVYAGPSVELRRVRFNGNEHFTKEQLEPFFENEKTKALQFGKRTFVLRDVKSGISRVESLYRNAGFLWTKVDLVQLTWSKDFATVRAVLRITEGPRARTAALRFEGGDRTAEDLLALAGDPVGEPFSPSLPFAIRNALLDDFANRGHPFAAVRVQSDVDEKAAAVTLVVKIEPGPQVRIRDVRIQGNAITRDPVIRHLAGLREGALFRSGDVRDSTTGLMRSGLFRGLEIRPVKIPDDPARVDLEIVVTEADDFVFTAAVGVGSYEILTTRAEILNRNIFGTGRTVRLAGFASIGDMPTVFEAASDPDVELKKYDFYEFRAGGLEAVVRDPWILYTPLETNLRFYFEQRAERSFTTRRGGWELPLTLTLVEKIRFTVAYELEFRITYLDVGFTNTTTSAARITLARDGRDDRFNPRWGTWVHLTHRYAGRELKGSLAFDESVLRAWAYASPFGDLVTFAFGGEGAVIDSKKTWNEERQRYVQEPIPISYRIFRGGDSTVRSFWYHGLGPLEPDGDPAGGEAYLQFNVEARIHVYKFLGLALFAEGGSLKRNSAWWLHLSGSEIPERDRFRYAVGAGLRVNTPIGPLRLDLGVNPDPLPDEDTWALHFSVGHPF